MAKTDYKSIDAYHAAFTGEVLQRLNSIRALIHKEAPDAEEVISYQLPAFKLGKHFLLYYAAFAKHITVSSPWSAGFLEHFASDLKDKKVSKSAIQFPNETPLPLELIRRMVAYRKKEVAAK